MAKEPNVVRTTGDQMHQLTIVPVEAFAFRTEKIAVGQIAFNDETSTAVTTPFSGRVTRLIAKVGDKVKRGDPLLEIDSQEVVQVQADLIAASEALESSKVRLALAKRVLDRQMMLLAEKATPQREVDQARNEHALAESDFKAAQSNVEAARNRVRVLLGRNQLDEAEIERSRRVSPLVTINAPIDGTVIGRKVGPGQFVRSDSSDALYTIADMSTMWLKANVPESDIPLLRVGQEISVSVVAFPDRVFKARIESIGASLDPATRRMVVRSEIANPEGAFKSQMFVGFKIATGEKEPSPAVPVDSVVRDGDLAAVWLEREPMVFERREVKLGMEQDGRLQIRDGLKVGEMVVSRGAIFLDNEVKQ